MTVKELIELLEQEDPEALVYQWPPEREDVAVTVNRIKRDILRGSEKTILIE